MAVFFLFPSVTKSGNIRFDGESVVSLQSLLEKSFMRLRRSLVCGKNPVFTFVVSQVFEGGS